MSKKFPRNMRKKRNERPNVGGVSIRSRNDAPSRKGCVVNGPMTKASNKWARLPARGGIPVVERRRKKMHRCALVAKR